MLQKRTCVSFRISLRHKHCEKNKLRRDRNLPKDNGVDPNKQNDVSDDLRDLRKEIDRLSTDFHLIENSASEKATFLKGLYMGLLFGIVGNLMVSHWIDVFHYFVPQQSIVSIYLSFTILTGSAIAIVILIYSYTHRIRELDKIRKEASELIMKLNKAITVLENIEQ